MTQNAMQAKTSRFFPEQSVFVSSIPSSMISIGTFESFYFFIQETVNYLESKHHKVDVVDPYFAKTYGGARVQAISVDENHIITANNDRRKEGEVDGF